MISKILQILSLQPLISKFFSINIFFFLAVGQNNFSNKIPLIADEHIVHCKTCVGEGGDACDDGENAKSEPCIMGEKSCLYGKTTSMLDKGTRFLIASLPRNLKIYLLLLFRLLLGNFLAGKISCSCSRSWNESPFVLFLTFIFR